MSKSLKADVLQTQQIAEDDMALINAQAKTPLAPEQI